MLCYLGHLNFPHFTNLPSPFALLYSTILLCFHFLLAAFLIPNFQFDFFANVLYVHDLPLHPVVVIIDAVHFRVAC